MTAIAPLAELNRHPPLRFNPLAGEWVQVLPQRTSRPWQGEVERVDAEAVPASRVTDFWSGESLGRLGSIAIEDMPPHSARLLVCE